MRNVSYELLDLLKQYQGDEEKLLHNESQPEYLYALSVIRENILEWYPFKEEGSVLLVGSDYGALMGLLSSKAASITVLEPLDEKAEVSKRRHKVSNVTYISEDLGSYDGKDAFDYVVMIGSPELSSKELIQKAMGLTKPGGVLLAAVDNPMSLRRFDGLYQDPDIPRLALSQIRQWFEGALIYYPIPDYRLPVTLYSDKRLPKKGELTNLSAAYDHPGYSFLDQEEIFDKLCEEGRFEEFAGSFLIHWQNGEER